MKISYLCLFAVAAVSSSAFSMGAGRPGAYACQARGERNRSILGTRVLKFSSPYLATESLAREVALDRCQKHPKTLPGTCTIDYCVHNSMAEIDDRVFD